MTITVAMLVNNPSKGTFANVVSRLAVGMAETGRVETTLVCYRDDAAPEWLPAGVRIHRLGTQRTSRSLRALVNYLRSEQPVVLITRQVHANHLGLVAAYVARTFLKWPGKLVVGHDHPAELSHASDWKDNKWIARLGYRYADGVIAVSPTVREDVIRWCRLDPSSVAIVPNPIIPSSGTSVKAPHPWLAPGEPPVFVTTARLVRYKRIDLLVDAFAELRMRHSARLLILGEGPERHALNQQIAQLGLEAEAATLGWVSDPCEFAARACAFVLPSDEEGFSQVLTEAMSVGCPVVVADALGGGPRYVTDNGRFGLLVPRGDCAQLVHAMEQMLVPEVRQHYSALGVERIEAFSPVSCATRLVEFLETLLVSASDH